MPQHTLYLLPQPKHVEPLDGTCSYPPAPRA